MDYQYMGMQIRHYRRQRGMSQTQLADALGLSAAHVGHIERASRRASLETVVAICEQLNVSMDVLIFPQHNPANAAAQPSAELLLEKLSEVQQLAVKLLS
jgi:transcriptional regulator with XRE-family HTH domain